MRILLLGGTGLLGWQLRRTLAPLGEIKAPSRADLDLQHFDALRGIVRQVQPDFVVNAAAYTDVDGAESEEELAYTVNAVAPGVLAEEVRDLGSFLIHYSTDYVFNGEKGTAYRENDEPDPINVYGKTKLLGERNIRESGVNGLILRLSWLYGARRANFLAKILKLLPTRRKLEVVDDQTGSPTWSRDAAETTSQLVTLLNRKGPPRVSGLRSRVPVLHLAAAGSATRYEQAVAIQKMGAVMFPDAPMDDCTIKAISSGQYPQGAERPAATPLNCDRLEKAYEVRLMDWEEGLLRCMETIQEMGLH